MDFDAAWERSAPLLEPALAHSRYAYGLSDVRAAVEASEARLWVGERSAMVTTIDEYPNFNALNIWLAGGDRYELVNSIRPRAEAWAAAERGCVKSTLTGRGGWTRLLAQHGYRPVATMLMKDIAS